MIIFVLASLGKESSLMTSNISFDKLKLFVLGFAHCLRLIPADFHFSSRRNQTLTNVQGLKKFQAHCTLDDCSENVKNHKKEKWVSESVLRTSALGMKCKFVSLKLREKNFCARVAPTVNLRLTFFFFLLRWLQLSSLFVALTMKWNEMHKSHFCFFISNNWILSFHGDQIVAAIFQISSSNENKKFFCLFCHLDFSRSLPWSRHSPVNSWLAATKLCRFHLSGGYQSARIPQRSPMNLSRARASQMMRQLSFGRTRFLSGSKANNGGFPVSRTKQPAWISSKHCWSTKAS